MSSKEFSEVVFAEHLGFCGGVMAANRLAEEVALQANEKEIAVFGLHKIVHNQDVAAKHEANGVTFVEDPSEIADKSAVITSAHGVGPEVVDLLQKKGCETFDATCPLVTFTHKSVESARREEEKVIYICDGKPGEVENLHDEVAGMVGYLDYRFDEARELTFDPVERTYLELGEDTEQLNNFLSSKEKYRIITQTTLHADKALKYREEVKANILSKQPDASVEFSKRGDVCRAVADRQDGVTQLVQLQPRRIVVVTDPTSKNGKGYVRLAEQLVENTEIQVHAVANAKDAEKIAEIDGLTAVTASASTPDETIAKVANVFGSKGIVESKDRSFSLHDGKPDVIAAKLETHKQFIRDKK